MSESLHDGLLQAALQIHERYGLFVCPFSIERREDGKYDKKPLMEKGSLDRWLKYGQEKEEIQNMDWDEANGLGVYCYKTKNGLFFCCLDLDMPEDEWRPLLKFLPVTQLDKTPRNGVHAYYLSQTEPPKTLVAKAGDVAAELLYRKWVIIYPSHGYSRLNDNPNPKIIQNVVEVFFDFLDKSGLGDAINMGNNAETFTCDTQTFERYLREVESFLKPHLAYDGGYYALYHCVFHPPDKSPSLYLRRDKGYVHDFTMALPIP